MQSVNGDKNLAFEEVRSLDRWPVPAFFYDNVSNFMDKSCLTTGIHSITASGLPLEILVDLKAGRPIVFFLNGAVPRSKDVKLPVFAGLSVVPSGEVSRVYINDPSLYLDQTLSLGWYAGSSQLNLQKILPDIITKIIKVARASKIMFVGGSGGGFASLYYSRLFYGSLAVPWNPQTNILDYVPVHVENYGKVAFGLNDIGASKAQLPNLIDTDLRQLYSSQDSGNYVLYLQNDSDSHVKDHLVPFLIAQGIESKECDKCLGGLVKHNIYVHMDNWGDGHAQPAKKFLMPLLRNLIGYDKEWSTLFRDCGIDNLIEKSKNS